MDAADVTFRAEDGHAMRAHLASPGGAGPHPGLLIIHESFGLNDDIRRITQRFASSGYAALAPDLFDRPGPRALCVARVVMALRGGAGEAFRDLESARGYLAALPNVDGQRLGIVGFCLGGGFALLTALQAPYRAAASFYGQVPKDAKWLEGICPVVAGYGGRDRIFAPHAARLERHLNALNVTHDIVVYPEAGHSFMSQHTPSVLVRLGAIGPMKVGYDAAAAEDSWKRMLAFLGKYV